MLGAEEGRDSSPSCVAVLIAMMLSGLEAKPAHAATFTVTNTSAFRRWGSLTSGSQTLTTTTPHDRHHQVQHPEQRPQLQCDYQRLYHSSTSGMPDR